MRGGTLALLQVRGPAEVVQALEDLGAFRELWGRLPGPVRWILARLWGRG